MEGDLQKSVGLNLKHVREGRGVTQEKLGEEIGHHRTYIGTIEQGRRNLTLRSVERLSQALGIDVLDLLIPGAVPDPATPPTG